MLSAKTLTSIQAATVAYWKKEVRKQEIIEIARGKEIGQRIAALVDEKSTALLTLNYVTRQQRDARGNKRSRSMGDLWLQDNGIYHPINVKTGIVGSEGQPNLVSLKKVLSAIMAHQIDSYYLLIVKIQIAANAIDPGVYLIDMLDWLEYVTFDSGPGQMMLKAVKFFREFDPKVTKTITVREKVKRLMALYEDGELRLKDNRERDLTIYRRQFETFMSDKDFVVTPETQKALNLQ